MIQASIVHLWQQKRGNHPVEFEDAFAYQSTIDFSRTQFYRVAISDGASESSFASEWAKILTRSYRDQPFLDLQDIHLRMVELCKRWQSIAFRRPLLWFAEEKARMGAYATLLGLELSYFQDKRPLSGHLRVVGIGDSCLFHIQNNLLKLAFPISRSSDFGNSPTLISSNMLMNQPVWDDVVFYEGDFHMGDSFILATDALSSWFLHAYEQNEDPWKELFSFLPPNQRLHDFTEWVEQKRQIGMRNDDVTLVIIQLTET